MRTRPPARRTQRLILRPEKVSILSKASGATATAPAQPGETIIIYMTGLGAVDGSVPPGMPSPSSPLLNATASIAVDIGDTNPVSVKPTFAGLAPGFIGVYQINATLPQSSPTGTVSLRLQNDALAASNTVTIPIE